LGAASRIVILAGDHDTCDPSLSREIQEDRRLAILSKSGHMTFVDQPELFLHAFGVFLDPARSKGVHAAN
jgi:pimeloyl-ACP methyl ester carboxylesterase